MSKYYAVKNLRQKPKVQQFVVKDDDGDELDIIEIEFDAVEHGLSQGECKCVLNYGGGGYKVWDTVSKIEGHVNRLARIIRGEGRNE